MYQQTPKRSNKRGNILMWVFFVAGAILLAIGLSNILPLGSILQTLALISFTAAIMLGVRFVFGEYEYTLDGDLFTVGEKRGNKLRISVRIKVSEIESVITVKDGTPLPESELERKKYDYRPSLLPKEYTALIITDHNYCNDGEELCILIEPDQKMLLLLSNGK